MDIYATRVSFFSIVKKTNKKKHWIKTWSNTLPCIEPKLTDLAEKKNKKLQMELLCSTFSSGLINRSDDWRWAL